MPTVKATCERLTDVVCVWISDFSGERLLLQANGSLWRRGESFPETIRVPGRFTQIKASLFAERRGMRRPAELKPIRCRMKREPRLHDEIILNGVRLQQVNSMPANGVFSEDELERRIRFYQDRVQHRLPCDGVPIAAFVSDIENPRTKQLQENQI